MLPSFATSPEESLPPFITLHDNSNENGGIDFFALELTPSSELFPDAMLEPCFVYLLKSGERGVLINSGPRCCRSQLIEKLDKIGVPLHRIERLIATNWDVRHLGNVDIFPNAQLIALSPDKIKPYNYCAVLESERFRLRSMLEELYLIKEQKDFDTKNALSMLPESIQEGEEILEDFISQYYDTPQILTFFPVQGESTIDLLGITFYIFDHSPFHRGQMILFEPENKILFGYSIPAIGLPKPFYSLAATIPMVDRIASMNPEIIASNHSGVEEAPSWLLKRARSFVKSFTENSPAALRKKPTLIEFVQQNFGYSHEFLVDYLFELIKFQDLLNELARDENIAIEGSGIAGRRYGLNVLDTRPPRLQF